MAPKLHEKLARAKISKPLAMTILIPARRAPLRDIPTGGLAPALTVKTFCG
jgi:hypothetical protein